MANSTDQTWADVYRSDVQRSSFPYYAPGLSCKRRGYKPTADAQANRMRYEPEVWA